MARVATEFRDSMLAMLPKGPAWPTDPDSMWGQLCHAIGEEFARVDAANEALLREMDTRSVSQLLPEWESDYGLPGACITEPQTPAQRRAALFAKYRYRGRQDRQFFIDVAAELGYTITITEFNAASPGPHTHYNGIALSGDDWNFIWQINASATTSSERVYGDEYGGDYVAFGNELLECTMRSLVHAHRVLFFSYS